MRIEFTYRLDEWLEWKRANLSAVRLLLLEIAEASELPLSILSVVSIVILFFRHLNGSTAMTVHFSSWVPGVLLTLLGIAELYLSRTPDLRKKVLQKEWKGWRARLEYKLDITENGIDFNSIQGSRTTWNRFTRVFQTNDC